MDALKILEEKVTSLITLVTALRMENEELLHANEQLSRKLKVVEGSALQDAESVGLLKRETQQTKTAVDDLIKVIDSLVSNQKQP